MIDTILDPRQHHGWLFGEDDLRLGRERRAVQAELVRALTSGPGIVVITGAFPDLGVVQRATEVFEALQDQAARRT